MTHAGNRRRCLRVGKVKNLVMNVLGFVVDESPDELFANENTFFWRHTVGIDVVDAMCLYGFLVFRLASGRLARGAILLFPAGGVFGLIALGTVIEAGFWLLGGFGFDALFDGFFEFLVFFFELC